MEIVSLADRHIYVYNGAIGGKYHPDTITYPTGLQGQGMIDYDTL